VNAKKTPYRTSAEPEKMEEKERKRDAGFIKNAFFSKGSPSPRAKTREGGARKGREGR